MPTAQKPCPFCIENGQVEVIRENEQAYLVAALDNGRITEGRYLVIPKAHIESILELPDDWQQSLKDLLASIPETAAGVPFNLSYNQGFDAGQRIRHAHAWIVFRQKEEGTSSFGLGLNALIERCRTIKTPNTDS